MGFQRKNKDEFKVKRIIPHDANNEQLLLGSALNNHEIREILIHETIASDFLHVNHQAIFECINYLHNENLEINIDSIDAVKERFEHGMKIKIEYLGKVKNTFNGEVSEENYKFHIRKLKADKVKDMLQVQMLPEFAKSLINPKVTIENLLEEISVIKNHIEERATDTAFKFIHSNIVDDKHNVVLKAREEKLIFGTTGYKKLDNIMTDGLSAKKITIIAGRPGMAKSALIANIFLRLGMLGVPVALYNFEMDDISMFDRMVSIRTRIPLEMIIKDREKMTDEDRKAEKAAKELIRNLPIYFYTASTQTIQGVKRDLKILKDKYAVEVVGYDLFKKMKMQSRYNSSTADMLSENLDTMQAMGKDLDIHQILVVQIGRAAERSKDKRPRLSQLKDSGGFEEVADNVLLLYREQYYQKAEEDEPESYDAFEELEVIVAKQRQGRANQKVTFTFYPANTSITDEV